MERPVERRGGSKTTMDQGGSRMSHLVRTMLGAGALLLLLTGHVACGTAPPEKAGFSSEKLRAIHALLADHVEKKRIAGAVALVARKDRLVYLDPVGFADVEAKKPMTPYTIFRICSMTKPITSAAVMLLVEEGRIGLRDPLSKFIPEFRGARVAVKSQGEGEADVQPARREITVRDLLTHTSGLTYTFLGREPFADLYRKAGVTDGLVETEITVEENARRLATVPLVFHPGTAWEYSLATDILGRVIEVASGERLDEFLEKRIFEPLGMTDTHFRLPPGKLDRLATVYQPGPDKTIEKLPAGPVKNGYAVYSSSYPRPGPSMYLSGGAGLSSTVLDYARFLQMLLNGGELDGARILTEESVALMTRNQCASLDIGIKSHGDAFGFGFGVVTEAGKDLGLGSPGTFSWGGFYYTYFWVDPKADLIGIVMAQLHPWGDLAVWDDFRKLVYAAAAER
jgi:CubicO group peptidase (beta-lactamase class C family)